MKLKRSVINAAALAAAFSAQVALAATVTPPATVIYGGGASFPANALNGNTFLAITPNAARLSQTKGIVAPAAPQTVAVTDKGSLFGALAAIDTTIGVSYCQTGSGAGRNVLTGAQPGTTACLDYTPGAAPVGFSAPVAGAHFAASDAPFSQAEINTFGTNKSATRSQPIQYPGVAGTIAIIYNNAALGKKKLNLTRSDICGIFSGSITGWEQLTHTPKVTISALTIKPVVRSDSSGTTFSFSNYLTASCPTLALPGDTAVTGYSMGNTFKTNVATTRPALPTANFVEASGNGGVVATVLATDGAIGYADIADASARAKLAGGTKLSYATVSYAADQLKEAVVIPKNGGTFTCKAGSIAKNKATGVYEPVGTITNTSTTKDLKYTCPAITYTKLDPAKNFVKKGVTSYAVTAQAAKTLGSVVAGRQSLVAVTATTYPGSVLPAPSCIQTVDPAAYAQASTAATKKAATDFETYPIVAVSYLMGYNGGYGADLAAVKKVLGAPFDTAVLAKTKTIGKTSGFMPVSVTFDGHANGAAYINTCVAN